MSKEQPYHYTLQISVKVHLQCGIFFFLDKISDTPWEVEELSTRAREVSVYSCSQFSKPLQFEVIVSINGLHLLLT